MIFNDDYSGSWLRGIRLYDGLTQKEMANRLGTNRGTYSSWESKYKRRRLPQKVLCRVYTYLFGQHKIEYKVEVYKQESIFKRILKWIMGKN